MKRDSRIGVVPVRDIKPWMLAYIAFDLRPEDRAEIEAHNLHNDWQLSKALEAAVGSATNAVLFMVEGRPALVLGITASFDGVYTAWGFGTSEARRALPHATRVLLKARDIWFRLGKAKRVEARVPVHSTHSVNWLSKLGFKIEALIHDYGRDDIEFFQLALTKRELFKDVPIQSTAAASSGGTSAAEVFH